MNYTSDKDTYRLDDEEHLEHLRRILQEHGLEQVWDACLEHDVYTSGKTSPCRLNLSALARKLKLKPAHMTKLWRKVQDILTTYR